MQAFSRNNNFTLFFESIEEIEQLKVLMEAKIQAIRNAPPGSKTDFARIDVTDYTGKEVIGSCTIAYDYGKVHG